MLAWSPDGASTATGGWQTGDLKLWDALTGERSASPRASAGFVLSVDFALDGSPIVTGATDGTIRLFDATTLKQLGANILATDNLWAFARVLPNDEVLVVSQSGHSGGGASIHRIGPTTRVRSRTGRSLGRSGRPSSLTGPTHLTAAERLVPGGGVEPPYQAPKARVLPLDDPEGSVSISQARHRGRRVHDRRPRQGGRHLRGRREGAEATTVGPDPVITRRARPPRARLRSPGRSRGGGRRRAPGGR